MERCELIHLGEFSGSVVLDMDRSRRALVNKVMKFLVTPKAGNALITKVITIFSKWGVVLGDRQVLLVIFLSY